MCLNRKLLIVALTLAVTGVVATGVRSAEMSERVEKNSQNLEWLVKHPTILRLLELHNQERARVGLFPSKLNPVMCLAAQKHAVWMAETGWMSHSGLPYRENIFMGVSTPEAATNGWIWSPAHHTNMLSGAEVGFGYMTLNGRPCWCSVMQ
ncbi:MAG: CAP domain-containing protein [Planctomycetaceae bacterium]|nr:CAP domain-containing protein [Planctomycetaceae bacterium]